MNSRERVLAAMGHRQPDRAAVDFSGHRSSGISAIAYHKLRGYLGLEERPIRVYDMVQQLAIVDDDVLDMFGVDTVEMGRGFLTEEKDWKDWVLPDGTACEIPYYINVEKRGEDWYLVKDGIEMGVQKKGCLYFEQIYFPLIGRPIEQESFEDIEEVGAYCMWAAAAHPGAHLALDEEGLGELAEGAKRLRESTDRAIVGLFGGNIFEAGHGLYRMDNNMMYMGLYPEAVERLSEKLCEINLRNLEKWLGAVGDYIDVIVFGDDLGGQNGLLMSPAMYRRFYKPYHKKMWGRAKELADVKVMLHCCGGIREVLGDLIEAGVDAVNPVQISCAGMDAAELKAEFGSEITFWGGGCDTRNVLAEFGPAEVSRHVREQVECLNAGGGFVFQQVHNIMADVPPANVVAMFKEVTEFR